LSSFNKIIQSEQQGSAKAGLPFKGVGDDNQAGFKKILSRVPDKSGKGNYSNIF
jgi:hypothetical protein